MPAAALGQIHAHGGGVLKRTRTGVVHEFEVIPLQGFGGVKSFLGEVHAVVARCMRCGVLPCHRVAAIGIGRQVGGFPLRGRSVEGGVFAAPGRTQLTIGDDRAVVTVGGGLIHLCPVI